MSAATTRIREAVFARADGHCECGCGRWLGDSGQMDHALSRRVPQSVANCWALTDTCHQRKTDSFGGAAAWLRLFVAHAEKHGYAAEAARARDRLAFVETRTALGDRAERLIGGAR